MTKHTSLLLTVLLLFSVGAAAPAAVQADTAASPSITVQENGTAPTNDSAADQNGPSAEENDSVAGESDDDDGLPQRSGEVQIQQPDYADSDVRLVSDGDRPVYEAYGAEFKIRPSNFGTGDVVDYGLTTDSGSLSYDPQWDHYVLDPQGNEGSFDVYWIVDHQEPGAETTERVQFVSTVRVADQASVTVVEPERYDEMQDNLRTYRSWNSTLTNLREDDLLLHRSLGHPEDNEETFDLSVGAYRNTRNFGVSLIHSYQGWLIVTVFSIGGLLGLAKFGILSLWPLRRVMRKLNIAEVNEAHEGELAERQAEQAMNERLNVPANWDYQDLKSVGDAHAKALREIAPTPTSFYAQLRSETSWQRICRDRLKAMSQCGYAARADVDALDDDAVTDGGEDEEIDLETLLDDHDVDADIVELDDVLEPDQQIDDREDLFSIESPSETLIDAVATDDAIWRSFDPRMADFDPSEFDDALGTMSIDVLVEELDPPMQYYRSKEEFGQHVLEIVQFVDEMLSDENGAVDGKYVVLNQLLQFEQEMSDCHGIPGARARAEGLEAAIRNYDPKEDVDRAFREMRQGTHA